MNNPCDMYISSEISPKKSRILFRICTFNENAITLSTNRIAVNIFMINEVYGKFIIAAILKRQKNRTTQEIQIIGTTNR